MKPHIVGAIFARGGSKGVLRKNVRILGGKPLIAHAIEAARASTLIDQVIVSTEDQEIAQIAQSWGADVPFMRPAELARDDSPEWHAWQHALRTLALSDERPIDVLVSIPTTAPLRAVEDIDACIRLLLKTDADIVVTITPAQRSPYFNMVALENDCVRLVIPPAREIHHRQASPPVFDMTTVAYAARPEFVLRASGLFEGKVQAVIVPRERALDIDSEFDLRIAEFLLTRTPVGARDIQD